MGCGDGLISVRYTLHAGLPQYFQGLPQHFAAVRYVN